ncbi:transglycosylase SLT domain-containing protein [Candidimonas sp. SYP-B2681]|uniref:transglycosylase SLT domain-containing protein n=1 Tax=Candidimonas sp. SYP-B2681 TaxID=2497686 RepID=UPI000F89289F|nr:transglycosylase SLT domain-containing protein [Candidimonas sp. SYP-B2681]
MKVEDFQVDVVAPTEIMASSDLEDEHGVRKEAITSYLAAKFNKDEETVREYVDLAWGEAEKHEGVSPELILAVVQKESGLRAGIKNKYGAQGLMQVVARWHPDKLHRRESLFDPSVNIRVGAEILQEYLTKAKNGLPGALKKYSGNSRGYVESIIRETKRLATIGNKAQDDQDEG